MSIRVAAVGYTNAWPLLTRLDRIQYRVIEGHPAEVARLLADREADVGLVPVAALLNASDWKVVPGFCIGSEGPVESVLLVSEEAPQAWERLLLDGVSRSSVVLAQILARRGRLGCAQDIEVVHVEPGQATALAGPRDAALVIGDSARGLPERFSQRIDLGQSWHDWTGLPFVFAVWAGRPDLPHEAILGLRRAAAEGLGMRQHLPEPDRSYLMDSIRYQLDDRALCGLRRFAALAVEEGLLANRDVELYGPPARMNPRQAVDELLARSARGEALTRDEALRLVLHATTSDLQAAANLRRWSLHPERRVSWTEQEEHRVHLLVIGRGESLEERLDLLLALADQAPLALSLYASDEHAYTDQDNTAADTLRWVSLARLLLPRLAHLVANPDDQGDGVAQACLWCGCDDWGRASDPAAAERCIRTAGFEPILRDADFEILGGPKTSGHYAGSRSQHI